MAVLARGRLYLLAAPVKTGPPVSVFRNVLVAVETQLALRSLTVRLVAVSTLRLILGVTVNYRTGHDETLEFMSGRVDGCQHGHRGSQGKEDFLFLPVGISVHGG